MSEFQLLPLLWLLGNVQTGRWLDWALLGSLGRVRVSSCCGVKNQQTHTKLHIQSRQEGFPRTAPGLHLSGVTAVPVVVVGPWLLLYPLPVSLQGMQTHPRCVHY